MHISIGTFPSSWQSGNIILDVNLKERLTKQNKTTIESVEGCHCYAGLQTSRPKIYSGWYGKTKRNRQTETMSCLSLLCSSRVGSYHFAWLNFIKYNHNSNNTIRGDCTIGPVFANAIHVRMGVNLFDFISFLFKQNTFYSFSNLQTMFNHILWK